MKTFSYAIKDGQVEANQEKVLYKRQSGAGVVTLQWFASNIVGMNYEARIRIYVDEETNASIDYQLYLAHGIGSADSIEDTLVPWGTKRISHTAKGGGISNTYRIPFLKALKVTLTHPKGGTFWYIIRGVENYPLVVGDLLLPKTAKLKLYKNVNVLLKPLEFLTLASVSDVAGLISQVTIAANSTDYNYLEACLRVRVDGGDTSFLSSGTEDFFLSAYYFNKGIYHMDNSGLTSKTGKGQMSAFKFFENDPLLFSKSVQLIWRCGELQSGNVTDKCPSSFSPATTSEDHVSLLSNGVKLAVTMATTYTWVYEWD